jgi:hypothetical protein
MLLRVKHLYYKLELLRAKINRKLPRILRFTKVGLLTTFASLVIATGLSTVYAQEQIPNLGSWVGREESYNGLIPQIIYTFGDITQGTTEVVDADSGVVEIKGSLLVASNDLIVNTYENTDQLSGIDYMAETLEDAGVVQKVEAQAPGAVTFKPVLEIWKVVRNVSLGFVVLIGLVLAVMILLRVRQGQGYVTILNALPKIIIAVLLILFSYSIAGFIVDLSNVAEKTGVSLFFNDKFLSQTEYLDRLPSETPNYYPANIFGPMGQDEIKEKYDYEEDNIQDFNIFRLISVFTEYKTWGSVDCEEGGGTCPLSVRDIIRSPTNIGLIDTGLDLVEKVPAEELLGLIITIVIITGVLKVFFALIENFTKMILYTIFAPVVFLFYPLSPGVAMSWFRYFLASSLLFPAAFLMMFLAAIIMGYPKAPWYTQETGTEIAGIAPNLLVYSTNVSENGEVNYLTRMVAIMIVLMIPILPQYIMQALKVTENMMYEGAKQSVKNIASKIPFIGGMFNM